MLEMRIAVGVMLLSAVFPDQVGVVEVDPKAKKDNVTETPPESADQSVKLKGVRG
jgi:hypothetical protein